MLAGSELIMTAMAVQLAAALVHSPGEARHAGSVLTEYNAYLASFEAGSSERARGSAPSRHDRVSG